MPGDVITTEVYVKYLNTNTGNWSTALNTLITSIAQGTAPGGTFIDGGSPGSVGGGALPFTPINHTGDGWSNSCHRRCCNRYSWREHCKKWIKSLVEFSRIWSAKPDPDVTGDHSVIKKNDKGETTGYTTYEKNVKNPTGFDETKRVKELT